MSLPNKTICPVDQKPCPCPPDEQRDCERASGRPAGTVADDRLTPEEAAALLWVIDGLPCMWSEKGECPYCAKRRLEYETARAKLEAGAR